jgi:ABC-type nickel/cobalt efflux system permease component RcnA
LQSLVLHGTSILGVQTGDESNGLLAFFVLAIGTALALLGLGLVQGATAKALVEIDQGREIGPLRAYLLALDSIRPLLGALLVAVVAVSLLASSIYLLPIAVWLAGRWALIAPAIELEGLSAIEGLRRSGRLVRGKWLKVASLIVVGGGLALIVGPIVGVLLILVTGAPFWLVNAVAGVIYALAMPLVAITTAYVYFDRRAADELSGEREPVQLPAEIELSS